MFGMGKIGYLGSVTKGIESRTKRKLIDEELLDHLTESNRFFKDIGYDEAISEDKAVEYMGDAEPVREQFCKIYNKSAEKAFKRIAFMLILFMGLAVLSLLHTGCDDDTIGFFYLAVMCAEFMLIYGGTLISIKKRDIFYAGSVIIGALIWDRINDLSYYIIMSALIAGYDNDAVLYPIAEAAALIILIPAMAGCGFTIVHSIRVAGLKNNRNDMKAKTAFTRLCSAAVIACICLIAVCVTAFSFGLKNEIEQSSQDYNDALSISQEIVNEYETSDLTMEEILKNHNIEYDYYNYTDGIYRIDNPYFLWLINTTDKACNPYDFTSNAHRVLLYKYRQSIEIGRYADFHFNKEETIYIPIAEKDES